jgi:CRP/FNR family cyclic AMP-dependent transcriptional regulator
MSSVKDLREADLFKGLKPTQIQPFAKHLGEEQFEPGKVIFKQGEPSQKLFILLEGEVSLGIKAKGEVDLTAYSISKKGEAFGLSSLIKPYRNNVTATCTKRARVLSMDGEILRNLIRRNSKVGLEMMEGVAAIYYNRLNSTRAMITNLFKMFKFQTGKSKLIETYYET